MGIRRRIRYMVNRLNIFLVLILFEASFVFANDKFCYRDSHGSLDCKESIEEIPSQYQANAFFKPAIAIQPQAKKPIERQAVPLPEIPTPPKESRAFSDLPPARTHDEPELSRENTAKEDGEIEIFVAKWCPHCKALEAFLTQRKVHYKKYDVEADDYGAQVYEREGTIPITLIKGKTILGFDQRKFGEILDAELPY